MAAPSFVVIAVDAAIVIIALECIVVVRWPKLAPRPRCASAVANLVAGACLMLALRAAIVDVPWPWLLVLITLSGAAHVGDWLLRSRRDADTAT